MRPLQLALLWLVTSSIAILISAGRTQRQPLSERVKGAEREVNGCAYGLLPGVWLSGELVGDRWRILHPQCRTKNYVQHFLPLPDSSSSPNSSSSKSSSSASSSDSSSSSKPSDSVSPSKPSDSSSGSSKLLELFKTSPRDTKLHGTGILYLSDSMDFHMLLHYCEVTSGHFSKDPKDRRSRHIDYHSCLHNSTAVGAPVLHIGHSYIITYSNESMVEFPAKSMAWTGGMLKFGFYERYLIAKKGFKQDFGREPDALIMGGGYWDLFYWLSGIGNEELGAKMRESGAIPMEVLVKWMTNFKAGVQAVKKLWPKTILIFHNYAFPRYRPSTGETLHANIGTKAMVAQINAAGMSVAQAEGMQCIDVNAMVSQFPDPSKYLSDLMHLKSWMSYEVLNVVLNIIASQKQENEASSD